MFLFACMAMAALVIDIGFARLAQRQLQSAADAAAVEGLRREDSATYEERRDAAGETASWYFDDDLGVTTGDDGAFDAGSGQFGAGPLVEFSEGQGDASLAARQLMEIDNDKPVHKPELLDGAESSHGSFRVSISRGTTDELDADLFANGPAIPYLFARGSLANRQLIASGITVRGTGLAEGSPAQSIGLADHTITPALPGLAPVALELSYWKRLATTEPDDGTGERRDEQPVVSGNIGPVEDPVGRFFTIATADTMPLTIGRTLPAAAGLDEVPYRCSGYVPIYARIAASSASSTLRVVGFSVIEVEVVNNGSGTIAKIVLHPSRIGTENVSAVRCFPADINEEEAAEVISLFASVEEPLLAAASRNDQP